MNSNRLTELDAMNLNKAIARVRKQRSAHAEGRRKSLYDESKWPMHKLEEYEARLMHLETLRRERNDLRARYRFEKDALFNNALKIARQHFDVEDFYGMSIGREDGAGLDLTITTHDGRSMTIKIAIK